MLDLFSTAIGTPEHLTRALCGAQRRLPTRHGCRSRAVWAQGGLTGSIAPPYRPKRPAGTVIGDTESRLSTRKHSSTPILV